MPPLYTATYYDADNLPVAEGSAPHWASALEQASIALVEYMEKHPGYKSPFRRAVEITDMPQKQIEAGEPPSLFKHIERREPL